MCVSQSRSDGTWYKDTKGGSKSSTEKVFSITKSKDDVNPEQNTQFKKGGSIPKYQTDGEKRYTPSMNTQQPFISWSTLQKDYPELYQKIINADNEGYRSFKETFVDKLANQPYKKTKLAKDFKIEESGCLECDWMHNTFCELDRDWETTVSFVISINYFLI